MKVKRKEKGAVLILAVLVMFVSVLSVVSLAVARIFSTQKEALQAEYYEHAIAAALSCREAAMARLANDFRYRTSTVISPSPSSPVNLSDILPQINRFLADPIFSGLFTKIDCQISVNSVSKPEDLAKINRILANTASSATPILLSTISNKDSFVEILSIGSVTLPPIFQNKKFSNTIHSIVGISYKYPVIIFTEVN